MKGKEASGEMAKHILTKKEKESKGFNLEKWLESKGFTLKDNIVYEIQWVVWKEEDGNDTD